MRIAIVSLLAIALLLTGVSESSLAEVGNSPRLETESFPPIGRRNPARPLSMIEFAACERFLEPVAEFVITQTTQSDPSFFQTGEGDSAEYYEIRPERPSALQNDILALTAAEGFVKYWDCAVKRGIILTPLPPADDNAIELPSPRRRPLN